MLSLVRSSAIGTISNSSTMASWLFRAFLVLVPQQIAPSKVLRIMGSPEDFTNMSIVADDGGNHCVWPAPELQGLSIGRALWQVLDLVNRIPTTSRKYEFARGLADKILMDNLQYGGRTLRDVNRRILEAAFARTIQLLSNCLEGFHRQQEVEAWSWPWRFFMGLPLSLLMQSVPVLAILKDKLGGVGQSQIILSPSPRKDSTGEMAEKLVHELLWLAQRLKDNDALEIAVLHWSSSTTLARLALCSGPRIQKLLVKLSAFLCTSLVSFEVSPPAEVTLKMLLLWLPLMCRSAHAIDETTFPASEKNEAERVISRAIQMLPDTFQEVVLSLWLREYMLSNSDWPNLRNCYHEWCQSTRKLNYFDRGE